MITFAQGVVVLLLVIGHRQDIGLNCQNCSGNGNPSLGPPGSAMYVTVVEIIGALRGTSGKQRAKRKVGFRFALSVFLRASFGPGW